jgi:hypothetical protein
MANNITAVKIHFFMALFLCERKSSQFRHKNYAGSLLLTNGKWSDAVICQHLAVSY